MLEKILILGISSISSRTSVDLPQTSCNVWPTCTREKTCGRLPRGRISCYMPRSQIFVQWKNFLLLFFYVLQLIDANGCYFDSQEFLLKVLLSHMTRCIYEVYYLCVRFSLALQFYTGYPNFLLAPNFIIFNGTPCRYICQK